MPNKPNIEVWLLFDLYKLPNKLSWVGVDGVLDQVKIRLTQPQVELELGLSLAIYFISLKRFSDFLQKNSDNPC